ncbi:hypothetical protein KIN20_035192 [Parelaphostrongylus tenuis]|uniref:Uncharacterized protein n=1 Tax=Parelaphostrongylus tenuis TaxID=148309 RepID=A0AAD5RAR8_PARTN|nr:hypothetical protein KIN20_035192 [Parelaphostrongylus tenuis]
MSSVPFLINSSAVDFLLDSFEGDSFDADSFEAVSSEEDDRSMLALRVPSTYQCEVCAPHVKRDLNFTVAA